MDLSDGANQNAMINRYVAYFQRSSEHDQEITVLKVCISQLKEPRGKVLAAHVSIQLIVVTSSLLSYLAEEDNVGLH